MFWEAMMKRTTFGYCALGPLECNRDIGKPYWNDDSIDAMDRAFCKRMLDAIAAGLEFCPKGVSTRPGTRHPIVNYRPPD
jgi:hypothetical protein